MSMTAREQMGKSPTFEILLEDFTVRQRGWPVGYTIERHRSDPIEPQLPGLQARVMEVTDAGFWVRRLTKAGTEAQRATKDGAVPVAWNLPPVIAINEWHYVAPRPGAR